MSECTAVDAPALVAFLERHVETSLFLLENLRTDGIVAGGPRYFVARDESAAIVGVVSVNRGGVLLLQSPESAPSLASLALRSSVIPTPGILGPSAQVAAVLEELALRDAPMRMHSDELLYALDLEAFRALPLEANHEARLATPSDLDALIAFRRAYAVEVLGAVEDASLDAAIRADATRMARDGATFVLCERDRLVAMTTFSARHRDVVQVGGVFTPPQLRGRGHARRVVSASLAHARTAWGAHRAVLFTAQRNVAAQRAYAALGFRRTGGYCLCFFREPLIA